MECINAAEMLGLGVLPEFESRRVFTTKQGLGEECFLTGD